MAMKRAGTASLLVLLGGCAAVGATGEAVTNTARFLDRELTPYSGGVAAPPPDAYDQPGPRPQRAPASVVAPQTPAQQAAAQRSQPRLHVAAEGETMESIAARYGFEVATLEQMNGLSPPYEVREGDVIVLPNPNLLVADTPAAVEIEAPPQTTIPVYVDPPRPGPPARTDGFYMRPVPGRIVTRFGAQDGGRRSDGIELEAVAGEAIRAAADGEVVYAGGDLPAYDNLLLIRHADGGVTAYGYARRLSVREGQRVRRGDVIGEAGPRGRVLFQARRGTTAVDPAPLIGE